MSTNSDYFGKSKKDGDETRDVLISGTSVLL